MSGIAGFGELLQRLQTGASFSLHYEVQDCVKQLRQPRGPRIEVVIYVVLLLCDAFGNLRL